MWGLQCGSALFRQASQLGRYGFSTTTPVCELRKLTRVNIVDNSIYAAKASTTTRVPRIIHVYNKKGVAGLGDKVLIAVAGEKKHAYVVGVRKRQPAHIPRYDANNVVIVDEAGNPLGTRIHAPMPSFLRQNENMAKIMAIAQKFV